MRPTVGKQAWRQTLRWTQGALFACGIFLLAYCGFAVMDAWFFQRRESGDLDRLLRDRSTASESAPHSEASAAPSLAAAVRTDGLIGRIEIPRLLLSAVVVEGSDESTFRRAVGHIPGTALPGQAGNVGLAGHRDTFFRSLRDLRIKDEVELSTLKGDFRYEVESLMVVEPDNVDVLAPSADNELTLVTCYPFSYIGTAPKRFVARARQVSPQTVSPAIVE